MRKIISLLLIFVLLAVSAGSVCFAETPPSVADEVRCDVYVNGKKVSDEAYTIKGNLYISLDTLKKYGDAGFFTFNTEDLKAYFNAADLDMFFADTETTNFIKSNAGKVYLPIKYFKGDYRISLGSVSQLCKLFYRYENGAVFLYPYKDIARILVAHKNAPALGMNGGKIGSSVKLANGTMVTIVSESTSFYKVKDFSGSEYYVSKADMDEKSGKTVSNYIRNSSAKDTLAAQFNLVWMTTEVRTNDTSLTGLAPEKQDGIDVMSPVWMRLDVDGGGSIRNYCEYGFTELCHANGVKVWACINNNFEAKGSTAFTTKMLTTKSMRNKAVAQYLLYACIYDVDGLNVDFEGMERSVIKEGYTAFIKELSKHGSKLGLTISLATPAASPYWQRYFDFAELGKVVDYICPMTYEEHYSRAVGAGSTMSPPWFSSTTDALAEIIGGDKVLMGVPFFTQYWEFDPSGNIVDCYAITMNTSMRYISEHDATPVWDEEAGQYIAEYELENGNTAKIWMEDPRSMAVKLQYTRDAGIAGTACWVYGQQTADMLDVFGKVFKQGVAPADIPGYW